MPRLSHAGISLMSLDNQFIADAKAMLAQCKSPDGPRDYPTLLGGCEWHLWQLLRVAERRGEALALAMTTEVYRIERFDGSIDGLGEEVLFRSEDAAERAAVEAFGDDPASLRDGLWSWLRIARLRVDNDDVRLEEAR